MVDKGLYKPVLAADLSKYLFARYKHQSTNTPTNPRPEVLCLKQHISILYLLTDKSCSYRRGFLLQTQISLRWLKEYKTTKEIQMALCLFSLMRRAIRE